MDDARELQQELAYFEANRTPWLAEHPGKYALVKGRALVGVFDTAEAAYIAAVERFGNVPVLIKQILEEDPNAHLPSLSLGLTRVDT